MSISRFGIFGKPNGTVDTWVFLSWSLPGMAVNIQVRVLKRSICLTDQLVRSA
jgi:hypothetical protein